MTAAANILIAEDDYAISLALKTILQKNINCKLTIVFNGQEAIDALNNKAFDLIISDWNMPVKTGQQLLEHVRRTANTRFMPFIMLTARSDKDSVINAAMCGVTDYIHKPFNRQDLVSKVSRIINKEGNSSEKNNSAAQEQGKNTSGAKSGNADEPKRRKIIDLIVEKLKNDDFSLPTSPEITYSALELLNDPDSTIQDIADIIKKDALTTTRLIAISNCSMYRSSRTNNTLEDAINRIGMKETSNYLWVLANSPLFTSKNVIFQGLLTQIKQHSLATAEAAQIVARRLKLSNPTDYYYMGLLHDVGSILILQILEELDTNEPVQDFNAVVNALNQLHHQFGAVLLKRWKMPDKMIDIAQYHDTPEQCKSWQTELRVIQFASFIAKKLGFGVDNSQQQDVDIDEQEILDDEAAKSLNIDIDLVSELKQRIPEYMRVMKSLL